MYRDFNKLYIVMQSRRRDGEYIPVGLFEKKGDAIAELTNRGMRYSRSKDIFYSNCKKKWFKIISLMRNELKKRL